MATHALQPWERIAWSPEHEQIIYRDWGLFYTHKQQLDIAVHYYNKSLDLKTGDPKALFFRSRCKRNIAQTEGALEDGRTASEIDAKNAPINLEICDALYELNQFENCKVELHDNTRKFFGKKVAAFLNRLIVKSACFSNNAVDELKLIGLATLPSDVESDSTSLYEKLLINQGHGLGSSQWTASQIDKN